jgi:PIF1 helicase.
MKNEEELTEKVYHDVSNISTMPLNWFLKRAILSPTNEQINDFIPSKFEASSQTNHSVDTVLDKEEEVHYPTEFLNYLTSLGILPNKFILK